MSLNLAERARTSAELKANFQRSGLTAAAVAAGLGLTAQELTDTFDLTPACRPEDVWALRDFLAAAAPDPQPYTVLTEDMRAAAARWFPLRP